MILFSVSSLWLAYSKLLKKYVPLDVYIFSGEYMSNEKEAPYKGFVLIRYDVE